MGADTSSRKGPIAAINVTPLVDVMLVLLVIFMVTTEMITEDDHAIAIELPTAASSDQVETPPLTVVVTKDGQYIQNGAPVTKEAIITSARELVARLGDSAEAIVAADKAASHEDFVKLLDLLRREGIYRFAIQTDVTSG